MNRAAISRLILAYNRRDWELNTISYDATYRLSFGASTDRPAGARDRYDGVDGLMEFLDLWHDVWGDFEFHLEDVLDAGPNRLLLLLRQTAHGRDELAMNERTAMASQFSEGRVVRQVFWRDRAAALAAQGLESRS
jgi:ketosteroid isomerase-like protein